jgi:LDH2 family malate/lactate/ureidoglycolate dehydrogenase
MAIVIDVLSSMLTGANFGTHIRRQYDNWNEPQQLGAFCWVFDIAAFTAPAEFTRRLKEFFGELRAVPPAEGFDRVSIPGELEAARKRERLARGVPLGDGVVTELSAFGAARGVAFPKAIA